MATNVVASRPPNGDQLQRGPLLQIAILGEALLMGVQSPSIAFWNQEIVGNEIRYGANSKNILWTSQLQLSLAKAELVVANYSYLQQVVASG